VPPPSELVSPILLYVACALGAIGVVLALPRRGANPQIIGGIIAAAGLAALFAAASVKAIGHLPNPNFYIFSIIGLGAALRVISHPRPVYAALYFILAILASCGLYVLLSAEFMAFALVIVYAGAILITYLFVIMLATEAPTAESEQALADYDKFSREPLIATVAGFVLVATLTTIMATGAAKLPAPTVQGDPNAALLTQLPKKVQKALEEARDPADASRPLLQDGERLARTASGTWAVDPVHRTATVVKAAGPSGDGPTRVVPLPASLEVYNVEGLAFTLLNEHPGAIEIAGVILLMAMLGAVVLARKKVEMDEAAKAAAITTIVVETPTGVKT
jgi:NADH-quinone oxidoreductase subunit J